AARSERVERAPEGLSSAAWAFILVGGACVLLLLGGIVVLALLPSQGPAGAQGPPPPGFNDRPAKRERPPLPPLALPEAPAPLPIRAHDLEKERTVKLPGKAARLCVGGGGRFLVLRLEGWKVLAVFDFDELRVVREITLDEREAVFAAGMRSLMVWLPDARRLQRFDLLTGDKEAEGRFDLPDGQLVSFCMGHASAGPLVASVSERKAVLIDPATLKEIPLPPVLREKEWDEGDPIPQELPGDLYWAGATGRLLGHTGSGPGMPSGIKAVSFRDGKVVRKSEHAGAWHVVPGPDGRHLYVGGHGVLTDAVGEVRDAAFSQPRGSGFASNLYLPAHHGPFYLHAQTYDFSPEEKQLPMGTVRVFRLGSREPIATLGKTAVCPYNGKGIDDSVWGPVRGVGIENTLHLVPKAKLLAVLPASRDELRLYPLDLGE
ncbi:MAG: hypothetical protein K2W96_00385, partial [Gemmataceae bacterium]|nr:hypothetical protein [Gemmataceae bacterium]